VQIRTELFCTCSIERATPAGGRAADREGRAAERQGGQHMSIESAPGANRPEFVQTPGVVACRTPDVSRQSAQQNRFKMDKQASTV
jgi:hypothetical protein